MICVRNILLSVLGLSSQYGHSSRSAAATMIMYHWYCKPEKNNLTWLSEEPEEDKKTGQIFRAVYHCNIPESVAINEK